MSPKVKAKPKETGKQNGSAVAVKPKARKEADTKAIQVAQGKIRMSDLATFVRSKWPKASPSDLIGFAEVCKRSQLNPFTGQIYMIPRWNSKTEQYDMSIQTGIDGGRAIAQRTGQYIGSEEPLFDDGLTLDQFYAKNTKAAYPRSCKVTVLKLLGGMVHRVTSSLSWVEFGEALAARPEGRFWRDSPCNQLAKCTEFKSLKIAFPEHTSGLTFGEQLSDVVIIETIRKEMEKKPATPALEHKPTAEKTQTFTERREEVAVRRGTAPAKPEAAKAEEGKPAMKPEQVQASRRLHAVMGKRNLPENVGKNYMKQQAFLKTGRNVEHLAEFSAHDIQNWAEFFERCPQEKIDEIKETVAP